jgi:hypothetical protein
MADTPLNTMRGYSEIKEMAAAAGYHGDLRPFLDAVPVDSWTNIEAAIKRAAANERLLMAAVAVALGWWLLRKAG